MHGIDMGGVFANGLAQSQRIQHLQGACGQGGAAGIETGRQRRFIGQGQRMTFHQRHGSSAMMTQQQRQQRPGHATADYQQRLLRHCFPISV